MDDEFDTNIDHWSKEDLLELFNLENYNENNINRVANALIEKSEKEKNTKVLKFLKLAKAKLLNHEENQIINNEKEDWVDNQYLKQNNMVQSDKITDRSNKIKIFDDDGHFQMKRQMLGVNQTYILPHVQGTINPTLKNTVTRTVIIDSQYRPNIYPYSNADPTLSTFSTDFTITLSESLTNVTGMELYSIHFPRSWYNIDSFIGNNFLTYLSSDNTKEVIEITPGNYTLETLITELNNKLQQYNLAVQHNNITNKLKLVNSNSQDITLILHDESLDNTLFSNTTLGWLLGFRITPVDNGNVELVIPKNDSVNADAMPVLYGPQYFILVLDDFNKNRMNKGIVTSVELNKKIELPKYTRNNMINCDNNIKEAVKTAPRQLTQAQLFTINSILDSREKIMVRQPAPTVTDTLAIIPLTGEGDTIVRYGNDLSMNKREYFGPVTIERIRARLLDDKGNPVNLNGRDWSFTIKIKQLYQY